MEVHRMLQAFCDHIVTFHPNMFWVFLGYEVKFFCIQSAEGVGKHVPFGFVVVDIIKTGTEKNSIPNSFYAEGLKKEVS